MNVLLIIGIVVFMTVLGQIFIKKGMNNVGKITLKDMFSKRIFEVVFDKFVFIGVSLYAFSMVFYLSAASMEDISFVYPLIGMGYILTAILAWLFLGEKLSLMRIIGILLISFGAYIVVIKW